MEKAQPSKTHLPKTMNQSQANPGQTGGQTLKPLEAKALNVTKEHSVFLVELGWNVGRTATDSGSQSRSYTDKKAALIWMHLVSSSISGEGGWKQCSGTTYRRKGWNTKVTGTVSF